MKEHLKVGAVILVAVFAAVFGAIKLSGTPQLGGDFAGGVLPTQLMTGASSGGLTGNGYVSPIGSLSAAAVNGLSIGGTDQYHGLTEYVTASGTPASVVTLGPLGATTSTATTSIAIPETAGLSIGAICSASSATTTVFVSGCLLASTNGATGTATVAYSNLTGAALAVPTSTIFRITFDQLPY
jgi:hypothetical protein